MEQVKRVKAGFHSGTKASDQNSLSSGLGSKLKIGKQTETWYQKPMRGFNFVLIRSDLDLMLIFLSGNWPSKSLLWSCELTYSLHSLSDMALQVVACYVPYFTNAAMLIYISSTSACSRGCWRGI